MVEESKNDDEIDKMLKDLSENSEEKPKFVDFSEKPENPEKPERPKKVQENSQKTHKVTFEEPQDDDINYKLKSIQKELHRMKKEDENKNPKEKNENSSSIFQKLQKFFSVFIVAFITNFSSDKILAENRSFAQNVLIKIFAASVISIFVLFVFLK